MKTAGKSSSVGRLEVALAVVVASSLGLLVFAALSVVGGDDPGGGVASVARDGGARAVLEAARPTLPAKAGDGSETLRGMVEDALGQPIAAVNVIAELELWAGVTGAPPPDAGGVGGNPVVVAVTAADGTFSLVGLAPGRHRLRVEGPGVVSAEVRFVDVPGPELRIVAAREVSVVGRVVAEPGGLGIADVAVFVDRDGLAQVEVATDASGEFRVDGLVAGMYRVWAIATTVSPEGELVSSRAAAAVRAPRLGRGPFEPIELVLLPAEIVRGRVVDAATQEGVIGVITLADGVGDEAPRTGASDATGAFSVVGVLPGRFTASATAPGYLAADAVSFETGRGYQPLLEVARGGAIAGTVVDIDGRPVDGAIVSTGGDALKVPVPIGASGRFVPSGELGILLGPVPPIPPLGRGPALVAVPTAPILSSAAPSRLITGPDGVFEIAGLAAGKFTVSASHPDYADGQTVELALTLGQRREGLTIVLAPGAFVVGRVDGDDGSTVGGATVTAQIRGGRTVIGTTEADGTYRIGPVGGNVDVTVAAVGYGAATENVRVEADRRSRVEVRADFRLPRANAKLAGRVVDIGGFGIAGATVAIEPGKNLLSRRVATTDSAGRFEIAGLPAGSYKARIDHPNFPDDNVTLEADKPERVVLEYGGGVALLVRNVHTGAGIAGVTFELTMADRKRRIVTDAAGNATAQAIASGTWRLAISAPGFARHRQTIAVPAGRRPGDVTARDVVIELFIGAVLAGEVRDETGQRVAGAKIKAGTVSGRTDQLGRFRLVDVLPGEDVELVAEKGARQSAESLNLSPGEQRLTMDVRILP